MTTFIVLASIATYLTIAGLVGWTAMRTYIRGTITTRLARTEEIWHSLRPEQRREAMTLPDYARTDAAMTGFVVGLLWPVTLPVIAVSRGIRSVMDKEIKKIAGEHEELINLREIAKREGWDL